MIKEASWALDSLGPARPNSLGARSARVPTISLMDRLLGLAATIGEDPSDTDEMRLRKALLVVLGLLISLLAVGWGLIYIIFGEPLGGAIPLTYTVLSLASVVLFTLTRRYDWFRFAQLRLMLVLTFVLMRAPGGFVPP